MAGTEHRSKTPNNRKASCGTAGKQDSGPFVLVHVFPTCYKPFVFITPLMKVTYRKDFDLGCGELRKENRIWNYSGLSNYQVNKRNKKNMFSQGKISY